MQYFIFKTNSKTLYFPNVDKKDRFLWRLYTPYSWVTSIYWFLWENITFFRIKNKCLQNELPNDYQNIFELIGSDYTLSFNSGNRGEEQKISVLAYNTKTNNKLFAKFSIKPKARQLSINEINILEKYGDNILIPKLIDKKVNDDFVFFSTTYIEGKQRKTIHLDNKILDLLLLISEKSSFKKNDLIFTFAHGDFCPWNIIEQKENLKLIDWEMAGEYPLGYDLFTYIFQTNFILKPKKSIDAIINENNKWISLYFKEWDINNWKFYLLQFIEKKLIIEENKTGQTLLLKFISLKTYAEKI